MRIVGISGSLQASSGNLSLLQRAAAFAPHGVIIEIYDGLRHLPHFDPDLTADGVSPAEVVDLRSHIAGADALLIASPEYGHSLPGSLKNAIDWLIGTGELEGKIVGVTASVVHTARGRRGLDALLRTLAAVSARIVGGEPIARDDRETDAIRDLVEMIVAAVVDARPSTVEP